MTPSWSLLSEYFQLGNWGRPFLLSYAAKKWIGMRGLHTSATFVRPKELGDKSGLLEDAPAQSPSTISTSCLGWKIEGDSQSLNVSSNLEDCKHKNTNQFSRLDLATDTARWTQVSWVFAFQYPHHPIATWWPSSVHIELKFKPEDPLGCIWWGETKQTTRFLTKFQLCNIIIPQDHFRLRRGTSQTPWPRQVHACCPREASRPIIGCFNPKKKIQKGSKCCLIENQKLL